MTKVKLREKAQDIADGIYLGHWIEGKAGDKIYSLCKEVVEKEKYKKQFCPFCSKSWWPRKAAK